MGSAIGLREDFNGAELRRLARVRGWSCRFAIPRPCRCTPFGEAQDMLAEISLAVAPGAHAVVLMDQAG